MKYLISICIVFMTLVHTTTSQVVTFDKMFDFDNQQEKGMSVVESDDGYVIFGHGTDWVDYEGWWIYKLIKLDKEGNLIDVVKHGEIGYEFYSAGLNNGNSLKSLAEGYGIASGRCCPNSECDIMFTKFDSNLELTFLKVYQDSTTWELAHNFVNTPDGGYAIIGTRYISNFFTNGRILLLKIDSTGNEEWKKIYHQASDANGWNIVNAYGGGYMLSGRRTLSGQSDPVIIKVNSDGIEEWRKTYGGLNNDAAGNIILSSDSTYLLAYPYDSLNATKAGRKIYHTVVKKLDIQGNVIWRYVYDYDLFASQNQIKEVSPGKGYVLTGMMLDTLLNFNYDPPQQFIEEIGFILRLDNNGNLMWERRYAWFNQHFGHHFLSYLHSIEPTSDGGLIATGFSAETPVQGANIWVLKLDSLGCLDGYCGLTDPDCYYLVYPDCKEVGMMERYINLEEIQAYPNPVSEHLYIEFQQFKDNRTFYLFSITGQRVLSTELKQAKTKINLSSTPPGLYIYYIADGDKVVYRGRVVVK